MIKYSLQVIVEQDEDGFYIAECPALQGCYSQGDTFEEAIENIKDVISNLLCKLRKLSQGLYEFFEYFGIEFTGVRLFP